MLRLIRSRLSYKVAVGASALTLFVMLTTGGAAYIVMSALIRNQVDDLLAGEALQRAERVADLLGGIAGHYHALAANPAVANALVDSLGRDAYLAPLIAEGTGGNGVPAQVSVTDYRGTPLIARPAPAQPDPWVAEAVARQTARARAVVEPSGVVLTVAEPIHYAHTGTAEGALVYRIRLADLVQRVGGAIAEGRAGELVLTDGGGQRHMAGFGAALNDAAALTAEAGVALPAPLDRFSLVVRIGAEPALLDQPLGRLTTAFVAIGLATMLLAVTISIAMGRRLTVPLSRLTDAATGFAFGSGPHAVFQIDGEDEIARLGTAFVGMVDRLNRAYHDLERRSQTLLSNAERVAQVGSAVWEVDPGRHLWSDQFHAILGLDPAGSPAGLRAFNDRVHPDDRARLARAMDDAMAGGGDGRLVADFRFVRPDGEERVGLLRAQVVREAARPVRVDLTLQDITERDRLERKLDALVSELRRSNEELEQFAYVASHDLRQPLRVVRSYVSLIEEAVEDKLDIETREFMDFIRDGVKRMDLLITDLLAYSRVGRTSRDGPVDMGRALDLALMDLQVEIDEAGAKIDYPARLPVVTGDTSETTRLFQNLIGNAVKYRAPDRHPVVEVGCADRDGAWEFHVTDNGIGILPEHVDRVFGIFQRLHARDEYEGTGIGLAICKKIVERQGGRIWIENREGGGGTTVRFIWPKLKRVQEPQPAGQI